MVKTTYYEALQRASLTIQEHALDDDVARYLLLELSGMDQTELLIHYRELMPSQLQETYRAAVVAYLNGESPQYIIGKADFFGRRFKVTPAVLIPRPETEELVDWILQDQTGDAITVLDVGTGSGAIGLTLKAERPTWQVKLSDISTAALEVAQQNAARLGLDVETRVGDLLAPYAGTAVDVIVMNPPYIDRSEEAEMDPSVLKSEPDIALFADHHGLAVYERLADELAKRVVVTKRVYLEIGYQQGQAVQQVFQRALPEAETTLKKDIATHDRMVRVVVNTQNGES